MIIGDGVRFVDNLVHSEYCSWPLVRVAGQQSMIRDNVFQITDDGCTSSAAIEVSGIRNRLIGNDVELALGGTGIRFLNSGHFYRDNTIIGSTDGFDLGSATEVDGGGNVSY